MSDSGSLSSSAPLPNLLQLHRHRLKKTEDPATQFLSATFIIDHVHSLTPATAQKPYCELAVKQLKKLALASNPYAPAQHLLANLYISGIPGFQSTHTPSYSKAFQLYSSASKRDHVESIFHLGLCYEMGLGTPQSNSRALWNYRKAAVSNHPGAMFRLGTSLLYGSLGQAANPRDGVKWLKLAAKYATPQYPHALYELGMLHEKGVENVIWPDWNYLLQLLSKGAELGCVRCQRKLGEAFEYGALGCEVDPGRSVYYFGLAAEGGDLDAMFELGGWYLTGVHDPKTGFTLAQSYTEAHRWVLRAAEGGSRRAMKAMGYFREVGVGCDVSEVEARWWYNKAANTPDDPIDKDDAGGLLGKVSRLAAQDGKKPAKTKQNASKRAMPAAKIAKKKSGDGKKSCVIM
ncbi:hypothetical protein BC832DRAFT_528687 [Gaertneriomyces semiglobifer]|nr:hypothetical protein BC832DRAFT_528687 [Gaertneriomyces semiglobifer]